MRGTPFFALAAIAWLMGGCKPEPKSSADATPGAVSPTARVILGEGPVRGGPAGYVGSDACVDCHREEHRTWHASFHRTMTQAIDRHSVVADFDHVILESGGERFTLSRQGDEHWVQIEDLDELAALPAGAAPPPPVRVRLAMVTGSHHMQVFWLPAGFGNAQIGFPFTWIIADHRWAPRHSVFIRDPASSPPVETWNMSCIRCHATAGQPRPRPEQQKFETRVGELGIACEACHGPGERHLDAMRKLAEARRDHPSAPLPQDLAIIHPAKLSPHRSAQVCGQCHSMKWFDRQEGWTEDGFRYRPGDDLEASTPVIRPARLAEQPWVQAVLEKHPTLLGEFFWSDGMIRVAGREYNGLIETACFQRGEMSCLSCHSMHDYQAPDDQLAPHRDSDEACIRCHDAAKFQALTHTHHPAGSDGALCYNCHLPHTSYALLKAVRQHQIDRPSVEKTIQTGRPNACNLCHLDQTLAWTADHLKQWYGQPSPVLSSEQHETSAALRWLLAGDAGQRALVAWHFGWEPARRASGTNWPAPFLSILLNDPYSAVRYIAYRSLRQQPHYEDFSFDFMGDAAARSAAVQEALTRAQVVSMNSKVRAATLLLSGEGKPDPGRISALTALRDDRPVHLRE